jgi:hypothetical protein
MQSLQPKPNIKSSTRVAKGGLTELQKKSIEDFEKFLDDAVEGKVVMNRGGAKKV